MGLSPLETLRAVAEGNDLFVRANLANSPAQVIRCFIDNPDFHRALEELRSQPRAPEEVLTRLNDLLAAEVDDDRRHPWDVAVAAYLFVLEQLGDRKALDQALNAVRESTLKNLFWANAVHNYLARDVVTGTPSTVDDITGTDASQTATPGADAIRTPAATSSLRSNQEGR